MPLSVDRLRLFFGVGLEAGIRANGEFVDKVLQIFNLLGDRSGALVENLLIYFD
jgi:hypothetical protein